MSRDKNKKNIFLCNAVGQRVHDLRKQSGMTQKELAKKLGYKTNVAVHKIETGEMPADVIILNKLAEIFDCDLHELITGKCPPALIRSIRKSFEAIVLAITISDQTIAQRKAILRDLLVCQARSGESHHAEIEAAKKALDEAESGVAELFKLLALVHTYDDLTKIFKDQPG